MYFCSDHNHAWLFRTFNLLVYAINNIGTDMITRRSCYHMLRTAPPHIHGCGCSLGSIFLYIVFSCTKNSISIYMYNKTVKTSL